MTSRFFALLSFIAFLSCSSTIKAQDLGQPAPNNRAIKLPEQDLDYYTPVPLPNILVVKTLPGFDLVLSNKQQYQDLHSILSAYGCDSIYRNFPQAKKPAQMQDALGRRLVDLTIIHILHFNTDIKHQEIIGKLKSLGYFEYVEPKNSYKPSYQPNDPEINPLTGQQFFYVYRMDVFNAWDVEQGDPSVVIGVVDTGMDISIAELSNHVAGWDVADNDADVSNFGNGHGTVVSGCASATTDNATDGIGVSFKCPFMPIKGAPNSSSGSINFGYEGIVYAADNGCSVLNLSWGGPGNYNQFEQDIIDYAVINNDIVVTAAAGNTDADLVFYPAAYDGVISVCASSDQIIGSGPTADTVIYKTSFGTYNYNLDIAAQGENYLAPTNGGGTTPAIGSSFSSPIVAGIAALVRSHYGSALNAIQVGELLRVTADVFDTIPGNELHKEKMGKGRVNAYKALTDVSTPAVRFSNEELVGSNNSKTHFFSGDTLALEMDLWNWLKPTDDLWVSISSPDPNVILIDSVMQIGVINSMAGTTLPTPFRFSISSAAVISQDVWIRVGFYDTAKAYFDYQYFKFPINPSYLDIDTNLTRLTVSSNGRFGYTDSPTNSQGSGFQYPDGNQFLYEGGLMLSSNSSQVSDCVRGTFGFIDNDFKSTSSIRYTKNSIKDQEAKAVFNDSLAALPIGVTVEQRSYAYHDSPDDQYIIMEYIITNNNSSTINTLHVGLFADWDIGNYTKNRMEYDFTRNISYTYELPFRDKYVGVSLLTNNAPLCYAMDNGSVPGNNINPNNNWTSAGKFSAMSNSIGRPQAGIIASGGFDVSHVFGGTLYNLEPGQKQTIAFAILAGGTVTSLQSSHDKAKAKFIQIHTSVPPSIIESSTCSASTYGVTLTAANSSNFNFYDDIAKQTLLTSGTTYTKQPITVKDTIVITNADSLYESAAVVYIFDPAKKTKAEFYATPGNAYANTNAELSFVSTSTNYDSLRWVFDDGDTMYTKQTQVTHDYFVTRTYLVELIAYANNGCNDTVKQAITVNGSNAVNLYPVPSTSELNVEVIMTGNDVYTLKAYNTLGQIVYSSDGHQPSDGPVNIDISEWNSGIYQVEVSAGNTRLQAKTVKLP